MCHCVSLFSIHMHVQVDKVNNIMITCVMKALKCKSSALEERGRVNIARARGFEKTHTLMNV